MSRHLTSRITVAVAAVISLAIQASALTDATQFNAQSLNQGRPLFFTENKGQWDDRVLFKADGAGGLTWFIERDGFTVLFSSSPTSIEGGDKGGVGSDSFAFTHDPFARFDPRKSNPPSVPPFNRSGEGGRAHALKFKFQHALPRTASNFLPEQTSSATAASVESSERLSWNNNYFLGNDESKWAPDCGNYQRVVLKDVWPGVDVVWRGEDSQRIKQIERIEPGSESASSVSSAVNMIEFDFLIHPGADVSQIRVECLGLTGDLSFNTESTGGTESAELSLGTSLGTLRMALPEAYQIEPDGSLQEVRAEFKVEGGSSFGVALPDGHDPAKPLVVDPLVYSTYLGGSETELAYAITADVDGGIIVSGYSFSHDFPVTEGALDEEYSNGYDAFIAKLDSECRNLVFCTYLGSGGNDIGYSLCMANTGGCIIAGWTDSQDFPTTEGTYDRELNGAWVDIFVCHLNGDGNRLVWSTYLGGGNHDYWPRIRLDDNSRIIVAGVTHSNDFPTTEGAFDSSFNEGGTDAFVSVLSEQGSELLSSTYLGGSGSEVLHALTVDRAGGIIVAGQTTSEDLSTSETAIDRSFNGGSDAFITRLSEDASELLYSTYLGENGEDIALALAPDGENGAIVAGYTNSRNFPITEGAYQNNFGGGEYDAFISHLNASGTELLYSTYCGGSSSDHAMTLIPDGVGGVVVGGYTNGNYPITEGAFQRGYGGGAWDGYISWLNAGGSSLDYSTYIGGSGQDNTVGLVPDGAGGIVAVGQTTSGDYPITDGTFQSNNGGIWDACITRIDIGLIPIHWITRSSALAITERDLVDFDVIGESHEENVNLSLSFSSPDLPESAIFEDHGDGSGTFTWQTTYGDAGNYTAHFVLSDGEHEISADVPIEVKELFHIELAQGWNLVSSPTPPADPDHRAVWRDLVERGNLEMVKDQGGFFYRPAINFKNLGAWDTQYGYQAKVTHADTLVVPGDPIADDSPITLNRVWSIVAYYPHESLTAPQAFVNVEDILEMVKDDRGRFYRPAIGFTNMGTLKRGKAYQVKVTEVGELVYPAGQGMQNAEFRMQNEEPKHFQAVTMTGANMSLLIADCGSRIGELGEIGAFTKEGLCVGSASFRNLESEIRIGLAVWGDDPTTPEIDGAREGEALGFRLWALGEENEVEVRWTEGEGMYTTDGFAMGEVNLGQAGTPILLPADFALYNTYPNPFNAVSRIAFDLPEASKVSIRVFDIAGREVAVLVSSNLEAGSHTAVWNAEKLNSGVYLVKMQAGSFVEVRKATVLK